MAGTGREVGQTAAVGFQVGVRRTLPMSREQAWQALTSPDGLKLWLGEVSSITLEAGHRYTTLEGNTGEFRVVKPLEQLRLTWQKRDWPKPCTLQIRILSSSADKSTISFHQEHLADAQLRAEMKAHWEDVLSAPALTGEVQEPS